MEQLTKTLARLIADESGATAIEYGLLAGLVAVGCILAFTATGGGLSNLFGTTSSGVGGEIEDAAAAASS